MSQLTQPKGLRLIQPPEPLPAPRPPAPVAVGDVVRVPSALTRPCGRKIRRDSYEVLKVLWGPDLDPPFRRPTWRLVIEAEMDCSALGRQFQKPSLQERLDARAAGIELATPFAAEPHRLFLDAGKYFAVAGDELATLPDHPLQND